MMILNSFINQGLWCHNNPLRKLKAGDSFGAQIAARIKNLTVFTHPHSPTFTDTDCSLESVNCVWTPPLRERKATPWKRNRKLGKNRIPSQKQESCLTLWLNGGRVDIELILQFRTAANVFWGQSCSRNCIGLRAELYMPRLQMCACLDVCRRKSERMGKVKVETELWKQRVWSLPTRTFPFPWSTGLLPPLQAQGVTSWTLWCCLLVRFHL